MNRIEFLREKVEDLYKVQNPNRADWADWLYENHVFVVAEKAKALARRYSVNEELAMAAALLHDIADAEMSRFDKRHAERSIEISRDFLQTCGFLGKEIDIIVDAIERHGCRNGQVPNSLEGKVMATADAVVHLTTSFYDYALETMMQREGKTHEQIQSWALPKIERDFKSKIFFDEVRDEVRADYEKAKALFLN